jgi:phosphotransacetylase
LIPDLDRRDKRVRPLGIQEHVMATLTLPHTNDLTIDQLLRRFWNEFSEMPGLRLTRAQAQRLWSVDAGTCARILEALTKADLLVCGEDGQYARAGADAIAARRMAKAALPPARVAGRARAQSGLR